LVVEAGESQNPNALLAGNLAHFLGLPLTKRKKSAFPFSSQFSPAQIQLPLLLELVAKNETDGEAIARAIKDAFFSGKASKSEDPEYNKMKLAKNTRSALVDYDLLDDTVWKLTSLGMKLYPVRDNPEELYAEFARHILLNKRGTDLIDIIKTLKVSGTEVTLETMADESRKRGLYLPFGSTHMSDMRAWLTKAGVFTDKDVIDDARVKQLIGYDTAQVSGLASLTPELQAFLKALANTTEKPPIVSSKVAHLAERLYGVKFPEKSLPRTLEPLEQLGFVKLTKTTGGRGAKPYLVTPTDQFNTQFLEPLLKAISGRTGLPIEELTRPFKEIYSELNSTSRYRKGVALELVAANLARILGLNVVAWRLRANETGGAEVDLIADGPRVVFNRWQIQCKNTRKATLDDIAKEVGLTSQLKSTVVMVVTTGNFTKPAVGFADSINKTTHLNVVLVSGSELRTIAGDASQLSILLEKKAERIMELKKEAVKLPS
jgi:site-specific DNA-methyltransferase (cytosine-N4-specific)